MANTFVGSAEFRWSNAVPVVVQHSTVINSTQTGNQSIQNIQTIGTSAEAIVVGDVVPGYLYFKNTDATNYIDLGIENTAITPIVFRLKAGEGVLVPTTNATWYAKANTAPCDLLVAACDA